MCLYSLQENIERREAVAKDQLFLRKIGDVPAFTAPDMPDVAVCLIEGTQIQVNGLPPEHAKELDVGVCALATVFVHKTRRGEAYDCLYFGPSYKEPILGKSIALSRLPLGLKIEVRSIPSQQAKHASVEERVAA